MSGFFHKQADKILNKVQNNQQSSSTPPPPRSKRGLCWPVENQDPVHIFTKPGSKISWLYNWSPNPTPNSSSLEFVPMQWNNINIDSLPQKLQKCGSSSLLAFNEPELNSQSNLSPQLAADEWIRVIEPLRHSVQLRAGSPGISSSPNGVKWMQEFLKLIRQKGSDVDFWCLHWYGETIGQFYDYIWSTHHQLDPSKPVWITEFAPTNWNERNPLSKEHVESFMQESVKYLDSLDWVERYAFFGAMRDCGTVGKWARMIDDEGKLTDLGRAYRDA